MLRRGKQVDRVHPHLGLTPTLSLQAHEAQQLLRNGTRDLPRIAHVLDNERVYGHRAESSNSYQLKTITLQVFLLVDEGTVKKYKADLSDEIEPQITELISRAEKGMEALQKKRLMLQRKVPPSSHTAV